MAVPTDLAELATAASCYCFDEKTSRQVLIYLLAQIAGNTSTPAELAEASKCYCGLPNKAINQIIVYLLDEIAT
jgi:hypothetical protein